MMQYIRYCHSHLRAKNKIHINECFEQQLIDFLRNYEIKQFFCFFDNFPLFFVNLIIEDLKLFLIDRVNALNSASELNTGNRLLYTIMSQFAAFGRITHWWADWWPLATLYNDEPLCGPFPIFSTLPEFSEFTLLIYS